MSRDSPDRFERTIPEQREAVREFLTRTGSVALLRHVNMRDGNRFTELNKVIDVSSSTLSKRLEEACNLFLLEVALETTDYGTNTLYQLTGAGRSVRHVMEERGVCRTYDKIQVLEEELEDSVQSVQEWVMAELY